MTIIYRGIRVDDGATVHVEDTENQTYVVLDWRLDLANHSPTGLEWGYGGSGPAQCALAILADALNDDAWAKRLYMEFKSVIATLPKGGWTMSLETVFGHIEKLDRKVLNRAETRRLTAGVDGDPIPHRPKRKWQVTLRQDAWVNFTTTVEAASAQEACDIAENAWKHGDDHPGVKFEESYVSRFDDITVDPDECEEVDAEGNPLPATA